MEDDKADRRTLMQHRIDEFGSVWDAWNIDDLLRFEMELKKEVNAKKLVLLYVPCPIAAMTTFLKLNSAQFLGGKKAWRLQKSKAEMAASIASSVGLTCKIEDDCHENPRFSQPT